MTHLQCYYTASEDATEATIKVHESIEDVNRVVKVKASSTAEALVDSMKLHAYPRVIGMHQDVSSTFIFTDERPGYRNHIILVLDDEESEASQRILRNARATADTIPGAAIFMYMDASRLSDFQKDILKQIKVEPEEAPIAAAVITKETAIEFFINSDGNLHDEMLYQWVGAVLGGSVKPTDKKSFDSDGDEMEDGDQ